MIFILAFQANQGFYVDDPMKSGWSIALSSKLRNISSDNDQDEVEKLEGLNITNKKIGTI